jgi:hypothetical protein
VYVGGEHVDISGCAAVGGLPTGDDKLAAACDVSVSGAEITLPSGAVTGPIDPFLDVVGVGGRCDVCECC